MPQNSASTAVEPLDQEVERLIDGLMASGAYADRHALLRTALRALAERPEPSAAERRLHAVTEGIGDAFYALDRDWRYVMINRAAEVYYGRPRDSMLGRRIWDLFPWSEGTDLRRRYEHAMATGEATSFESASVGRPGRSLEVRLFRFDGGLGVSFRDWTERRRIEEALRESEARLRLAVEAGRLAIWEYDLATDSIKPSQELNEILGYPRDATLDLAEVRSRYAPGERERLQRIAQDVLARGDRFMQVEYRFRRPDGAWIWLLLRAEIMLRSGGMPERILGVVLDITERRQAEEALRESEARLGIAATAASLGIWDWNLTENRMIYTDRAKDIFGFARDREVTVSMVREATHPDDLPRTSALARRSLDPVLREKVPYEYRIRRTDGEERWVVAHGEAVFETVDGEDRAVRYVGTIQDITEQKRADEHQRLLIHELNHRVKNTLATVQSIAAQSLRAVEAAEEGGLVALARTAFENRLFALARAHDVLTRENWESASLSDIVEEAAAPHRSGSAGADPFTILGPILRVSPQMALSLSMALHELATNAVKYGALSRPGGEVRITWAVAGHGEDRRLRLQWQERGGPPVSPPAKAGFGTRLIERGLARELGGSVDLAFKPDGVSCLVDVPLGRPGAWTL